MPIIWNKFRFYKGTVGDEHSALVRLLKSSSAFWKAYVHFFKINGKKESNIKALKPIMRKIKKATKKLPFFKKKQEKILLNIKEEFKKSLKDVSEMSKDMENVLLDDDLLLYRAMLQLYEIYMHLKKIKHVPERFLNSSLHNLRVIMHHMYHVQHHAWVLSKAHSRHRIKLADLTFVGTPRERKKIRRQVIELDHLVNRIEPIKKIIEDMKIAKSHKEHEILHMSMHNILHLYHKEVSDIAYILHEAHVLSKRTDNMFDALKKELADIDDVELNSILTRFQKIFKEIHDVLETQARRETQEMAQIVAKIEEDKISYRAVA